MSAIVNDCVIGQQDNIVLVDFSRKPDPPAPRFPGASGLREAWSSTSNSGLDQLMRFPLATQRRR
jgi:hypothetical protein